MYLIFNELIHVFTSDKTCSKVFRLVADLGGKEANPAGVVFFCDCPLYCDFLFVFVLFL